MNRVLAFLGAGEFEPWSEVVDRWVLERSDGDGSVLVLPTASAPEGDDVFDGWARKGLAHFASLGVPAAVLPIRRREDAEREDLASDAVWKPGSSYVRGVLFAPHWDTVERWYPGAHAFIQRSVRPGETLVGIDEATAMVGDGATWEVLGRSAVHVYRAGRWMRAPAGERFRLPLEMGPPGEV